MESHRKVKKQLITFILLSSGPSMWQNNPCHLLALFYSKVVPDRESYSWVVYDALTLTEKKLPDCFNNHQRKIPKRTRVLVSRLDYCSCLLICWVKGLPRIYAECTKLRRDHNPSIFNLSLGLFWNRFLKKKVLRLTITLFSLLHFDVLVRQKLGCSWKEDFFHSFHRTIKQSGAVDQVSWEIC